MITEKTYDQMKDLIKQYEDNLGKTESEEEVAKKPYLTTLRISETRKYNPKFGDNKECVCGHSYYRHFDSYEQMEPVGCKYCGCYTFELAE